MLKATADWQGTVQVQNKDELVATLQRTGRFHIGGKEYVIARHTITWPKFTLHCDDMMLAEAERTSAFRYTYGICYNGKTWTMKPEGLLERKAVLYSDKAAKAGSLVSKSFLNPTSEVAIDLPSEIALEAQVFVLWLFLQMLHTRAR
jgi:hypothetical protein